MPGEAIYVTIEGTGGQAIVGTDRRLFVCKGGFLAGAAFGRKTASWDYRNVAGIHMDHGLMSGIIVVQAPGTDGTPVKYQSRKEREDAFRAPHAIPLVAGQLRGAQLRVQRLRELVAAAQAGQPVPLPAADRAALPAAPEAPVPAPPSPLDDLRKLAELHAAGALSDEEFAAAKARVLARL